jgi:RimJ/RimL family protein N-acetyltransferase
VPLPPPECPLTDGVVILRPVDERDVDGVAEAARDPDIRRRFGLSKLKPDEYVAAYRAAAADGTAIAFAICEGRDAEAVGHVLVELRDAGRADIGYWLLPEKRGRGLATRGVRLAAQWALANAGVSRLQLWTTPQNVASQRVAERAGFKREGVLRAYGEVDGERVDAVFYSLLPSDVAENE